MRGNRDLKDLLESDVSGRHAIRHLMASTVTGNALVFYEAGQDIAVVVRIVEEALVRPRLPRDAPAPAAQTPQPWHARAVQQVAAYWNTSFRSGLTAEAAAARLQTHGRNLLPRAAERTAFDLLAAQLRTLPNALLLGSALLSIATGGLADAAAVVAVVVFNAAIGFATEYKAEQTIGSLLRISDPQAIVIRNGRRRQIAASDVVPGDLLVLAAGAEVPADARLIESSGLSVDESALTGESLPVEKSVEPIQTERVPLADRTNMVFRGTVVTGGSGNAIVVATGRATAIGQVQDLITQTSQPQTPLQSKMADLARRLSWGVFGVSGAVFVLGLARGLSFIETLNAAVSLAVAAVPEQLPAVTTVCLARGVQSLAKEGVLVRRLDALEALGSVDTVCFDKTGTLTLNQMALVSIATFGHFYDVTGGTLLERGRPVSVDDRPAVSKLIDVCCLASEARLEPAPGEPRIAGSPTETALLRAAMAFGEDVAGLRREAPVVRTQPRSHHHAYLATWHQTAGNRNLLAVKGAPAEVLDLCPSCLTNGKTAPLDSGRRKQIQDANARLAGRGLRVLGVAFLESSELPETPRDLVWLGLVGIADPPRHGLREVLSAMHRAGIETLLLTGDQSATAAAIADRLGLGGGTPLNAADLAKMPPAEVARAARQSHVLARVNPSEKLLVVQALQRAGAVVAMTGDGTNDAPALKAADIGITLGTAGTRVAHGIADIVLLGDNIGTLLPAVREGRAVYRNLRKTLRFIAPTNGSEVLVTLAALAAGFGLPFNARQLLWTNLLTDILPALALAIERPDTDLLSLPPHPRSAPIVGRADYRQLAVETSVLSAASLAAYAYGLARYGSGPRAGSAAFLALVGAQLLHAVTARAEEPTGLLHTPENPLLGAALVFGFGLLAVSQIVPPLTRGLGMERAGIFDLLVCGAAALGSFAANETLKAAAGPYHTITVSRKDSNYALSPES